MRAKKGCGEVLYIEEDRPRPFLHSDVAAEAHRGQRWWEWQQRAGM